MWIMSLASGWRLFLQDEVHPFHPPPVLLPCGDDVETGRFNAAVPEDVGQLCDVLVDSVKHPGEQMPQIVREHLLGIDIGGTTQSFHLPPDIGAIHGLAGSGDKHRA